MTNAYAVMFFLLSSVASHVLRFNCHLKHSNMTWPRVPVQFALC